jgi:hypothetical protein
VAKTKVRVVLSLMKELDLVRELRGARFTLRREALGTEELARMASEWDELAAALNLPVRGRTARRARPGASR